MKRDESLLLGLGAVALYFLLRPKKGIGGGSSVLPTIPTIPAEPGTVEPPDVAPAEPSDTKLPRFGPFAPGSRCNKIGVFVNGILFPQGPEKFRRATTRLAELGVGVPGYAMETEQGAIGWLGSADAKNKVRVLQMKFRSKGYPAHGPGNANQDGQVGPCVLVDTEQALIDKQAGRWP